MLAAEERFSPDLDLSRAFEVSLDFELSPDLGPSPDFDFSVDPPLSLDLASDGVVSEDDPFDSEDSNELELRARESVT